MRRILFYVPAVLLIMNHAVAQVKKTIDASLLCVMKPAYTQQSVAIDDSITTVISVLGQPTKITEVYFEMMDQFVKYYWYGNSHLTISEGRLYGYEITDRSLCIGDGKGLIVNIGDKIKTTNLNADPTMPFIPGGESRSFLPFELTDIPGTTRNIRYKAIVAGAIKFPTYIDDRVVCLLFNDSDTLFNIFL